VQINKDFINFVTCETGVFSNYIPIELYNFLQCTAVLTNVLDS